MFAIIQVGISKNCPSTTGPIHVRPTMDEAIDLAVSLVGDNLTEPTDPTEDEVREELEQDSRYADVNGEWSVCIESIAPKSDFPQQ